MPEAQKRFRSCLRSFLQILLHLFLHVLTSLVLTGFGSSANISQLRRSINQQVVAKPEKHRKDIWPGWDPGWPHHWWSPKCPRSSPLQPPLSFWAFTKDNPSLSVSLNDLYRTMFATCRRFKEEVKSSRLLVKIQRAHLNLLCRYVCHRKYFMLFWRFFNHGSCWFIIMNDYYFFLNEEYVKSDRNLKKKKRKESLSCGLLSSGLAKGKEYPRNKGFYRKLTYSCGFPSPVIFFTVLILEFWDRVITI